MKKFNCVINSRLRWYDTATGSTFETVDESQFGKSELDFSRIILKTKPITITGLGEAPFLSDIKSEKPSPFCFNGIKSDENDRIIFKTEGKPVVVISKNLTDFLYCSTGQPFRSCYALTYEGSDRKRDLTSLHAQKDVYIVYITQETDVFEKTGVKYPKMQGRLWLYTNGLQYGAGRPYGVKGFELREALRKLVPGGLSTGFNLNMEITFDLNDNVDREKKFCHDRLDGVFNTEKLYKSEAELCFI